MNKAQFVEAIALDANIPKVEARKAIDAMIRVTVQSLREGERLPQPAHGRRREDSAPQGHQVPSLGRDRMIRPAKPCIHA